MIDGLDPARTGPDAPDAPVTSATSPVLTGVVGGLLVAAVFRQGAFYAGDAGLVAVVSVVVTVALLARAPDRRSAAVVAAVAAFAAWWCVRAAAQGRASAFLPLGASALGFGCAFLATRRLQEPHRRLAATFVVAVGAVSAGVGLVATAVRWYPLAMPAQNLWRLSTTLTYSNAAGALLAMTLLVGLGLDPGARSARVMVCLCSAGLVATQSRGAVLAAVVGLVLVPLAQLRRTAVTVALGVVGGLAVVGTSNGGHGQPLALAAVVVVSALAAVVPPWHRRQPHLALPSSDPTWASSGQGADASTWVGSGADAPTGAGARGGGGPWSVRRRVLLVAGIGVVAVAVLVGAGVALKTPIERRVALASSEDRSYEWRSAFDQFRSSPLVGVGPDQLLQFRAPDGDVAHFSHNEYLQILADSGVVGELLLGLAVVCVVRAVRRRDVASSCATAALVSFAVAATLDFDWHLAALGLLGGWVAGLAGQGPPATPAPVHTDSVDGTLPRPSSALDVHVADVPPAARGL